MNNKFYRVVDRKSKKFLHEYLFDEVEVINWISKRLGLKQYDPFAFLVVEFFLYEKPKFYIVQNKKLVIFTEQKEQLINALF